MVSSIPKDKNKGRPKKDKHTVICRYCGISRPECEMTSVTKIPEQLSAWIEILGPEFAENIKNTKANLICLNHIENESRGFYRLPKNVNNITLVNSKPKTRKVPKCKTGGHTKCQYCGTACPQRDMTTVPVIPEQLSKWIKILGPKFAENIKKSKVSWICWTHFDNRGNGRYRMPKKMPNNSKSKKVGENKDRKAESLRKRKHNKSINVNVQIDENNQEIPNAAENMKEKKSRRSGRLSKKTQNVPIIVRNEIEENVEEVDKEQNQIEEVGCPTENMHIENASVENGTEENVEEVANEQNQGMEPEVYDSTENMQSEPNTVEDRTENVEDVVIEQNQEMEPELVNSTGKMQSEHNTAGGGIGEDVEEVVVEQNQTVKEIEKNLSVTVPKPKKSERMIDKEGKPDTTNHSNFINIIVKLENESARPPSAKSEILDSETNNKNVQCRVCGVHCEKKMMTKTPKDSATIKIWFDLLGEAFLQNMMLNSAPHFICMIHLPGMIDKVCDKEYSA